MALVNELTAVLSLASTKNAAAFHRTVVALLEDIGFSCNVEVPVPDRGDGRSGNIDVVAIRDGVTIALELDRVSPREKSLFKLQNFPCDARFVALRSPVFRLEPVS